ncbi:MAG: adenylate/guanylate cyclase domain-containing protein [Burkholderiales bacterium]|nr:adenylate/guanylate cyclase domain-containing protein [Burkholderiales bacterium]
MRVATPDQEPRLARAVRAVLVIDLVESVRLYEADQEDTARRWRRLVDRVERDVLPSRGGRLVKSLGDGLMLEFAHAQPAVSAAFAIQHACGGLNEGVPPERRMLLRAGVHAGELIADDLDVYGHSVNLAARLTTLAGPGEIVVSAEVRDGLTPILDADIEDLGECYLKHVQQPVRAYRVGPPGEQPIIEPGGATAAELRPTIAVVPLTARSVEPEHRLLGEVLADEIISALSRAAELNVISRLSTTAFRDREAPPAEVAAHLGANYILSGSYRTAGDQCVVVAELADAANGRVLWGHSLKGSVRGIVAGEDRLIDQIVSQCGTAVVAREVSRALSLPLPTLESYTLLIGAVTAMHRLSLREFERARGMLETLVDRARRQPVPHAWLAKWHVLRVQQGWTDDPAREAQRALDCTRRALDADPEHPLALTIDGMVHTHLVKRHDLAAERYDQALRANPNESLAWLLKGILHAFRGEGRAAVQGTERALRLSPLDPLRYFYDSLAATAALSAERWERAIALAQRSLRHNRTHTSTLRAMAIAQVRAGRLDDARATVAELMRLEPSLTVTRYRERNPSAGYETGKLWAEALRQAGVPE